VTGAILAVALGAVSLAAPRVAVTARALAPGEVVVVTVTAAEAPVSVHAFEREWPVYADGARWRALVGIDLDTRPGRYEVEVEAGGDRVVRPLAVRAKSFRTRRLRVDPDLVNPPAEAMERITREAQAFSALWASQTPRRLWRGAFVRPVPDRANSAFGTRSVYNGEPRSAHSGADFLSPAGRPVKAPAAGRVVVAGPRYFTGNTIVIDHGLGLYSLLAHLSSMAVSEGDEVRAGERIGKVGATGRVTGPHLHWTVRLDGARVDPLSLLWATASAARGAKH
jgi:murein DD-endopeptidase MepM/ murein hydrolase activator NlpD